MILALPPAPAPAYHDSVPARAAVPCRGETITRLEVRRFAPGGRRLHAGADTAVILAYVRLAPGRRCLERDRADSERMLRAQRFLASAAVIPVPDGAGRVAIRVDVVDEVPWVVGARLRGTQVQSLRVGSLDAGGAGRMIVGTVSRGGAYRSGAGLEVQQPGFLGRPAVLQASAERAPLGGGARLAVVQPFLVNAQHDAFFASVSAATTYGVLVRGDSADGAVRTRRGAHELGWLRRIGGAGRVVGLAGLSYVGSETNAGEAIVRITDAGLVPTTDATLAGTAARTSTRHAAAILGVRALGFVPVTGFDALRASQDVARGIEATVMGGPSLTRGGEDLLLGAGLYAGAGSTGSFVTLRARAEGRAVRSPGASLGDAAWTGAVSAARLTWYRVHGEAWTRIVTLSASSIQGMPFPAQLTMRDLDDGLLGYGESRRAGGRRASARLEQRHLLTRRGATADLAVGMFADVGQLWAGDVPYGADSPLLGTVGVSLLGAYPNGGKRIYRIDVGLPLVRGPGEQGVLVRFSARDRIRDRWPEASDVRASRAEVGVSRLLRW